MEPKKVVGLLFLVVLAIWVIGWTSTHYRRTDASKNEQASLADKWQTSAYRHPMDDSQIVAFSVDSEDLIDGPLKPVRPTLMVRCAGLPRGGIEVFVMTGMPASVERHTEGLYLDDNDHTVRLRFDKEEAETQYWSEAADQKALFTGRDARGIGLSTTNVVKKLTETQTLTFQFFPFNQNPAIARFDVRNLEAHLRQATICSDWSN